MNIIIPLNDFDKTNIFFEKSVKNIVLEDSDFIKIIYSNDLCVLNNLYMSFKLYIYQYTDMFNKRKYYFNNYDNYNTIQMILNIEKNILRLANIHTIYPRFVIHETLENGILSCIKTQNIKYQTTTYDGIYDINQQKKNYHKIVSLTPTEFILKISGIWVTKTNYGITYKFIEYRN